MEDEIRNLKKTRIAINRVNQLIKRYSKIEYRKMKLRNTLRILKNREKELINEIFQTYYGVDLTSISVIPLSQKRSRYLRNNQGYFNNLNLVILFNGKNGYGIFTNKSQLRSTEIERIKRLTQISKVYSDRDFKGTIKLPKRYTQQIERLFSKIKLSIYKQLRDKQKIVKGKILTQVSAQILVNLYIEEFKKHNVKILNNPKF